MIPQRLLYACILLVLPYNPSLAITDSSATTAQGRIVDPLNLLSKNPKAKGPRRKKFLSFNFENEDLVTIINYLAAEKKVNIILPMPPYNITSKVTLRNQKKLLVDDAFTMLQTILDVAGYTMLPHGNNSYIIAKSDANVLRDALPIYIGIAPEELPDSDERIRFIYFFDNIKIPPGGTGQAQEIKTILEDMLQDPSKPGSAQILFDSTTNSVIITAKSYSVKVAMQVVGELDKTGFREVVEIVKLVNTTAGIVGRFLVEQLLAPTTAERSGTVAPSTFDTSFFAKTTKVIPDSRANTLIILGRAQAVERLKDFIYKYIDIPLESGESLIHIYELQYLDAQKFSEDLRNIIKPREVTGQAKGATTEEHSFQGVIIEAEKVGEAGKLETKVGDVGVAVQGGNRLIIAAKKSDWVVIKRLIEDLDKPQPQVSLEVLVVDVTLIDAKHIESQIRNRTNALPNNVNAQFAGLNRPVLGPPDLSIPRTLMANLLQLQNLVAEAPRNLATQENPGSLIISVNDPNQSGIWWVMSILQQFTTSKILSHPHLITVNQQQAKISLALSKLIDGPIKQNPDGSTVREKVNVNAELQVEILPRINLSNTINLQIAVKVNNFIEESNNRNTRSVITNATVGNGEILVLGGLIKNTEIDDTSEVPVLGKIPLVGWLFRSKSKDISKDNLMIFISPTVVKPKVGGGMNSATKAKFNFGQHDILDSELFDQMKDPITRWFFYPPPDDQKDLVSLYEHGGSFSEQSLAGGEIDGVKKQVPVQKSMKKTTQKKLPAQKKMVEQKNKKIIPAKPTRTLYEEQSEQKLKNLLVDQKNPLDNSAI